VVSDLFKPRPNKYLTAWIEERDEESLFLSVLTLGEIRQGIEMLSPDSKKRMRYEQLLGDLRARFGGRILEIDHVVAEAWGELSGRSRIERRGPLSTLDSLIAATAIVHRLVVATGNVRHFQRTGANVINPFEKS
jgi:toxin FitB